MKPHSGYVAVFLGCLILFGPERTPLDDITNQELQIRFCTEAMEPRLYIERRTYQRLMTPAGPRYISPDLSAEEYERPQESWWKGDYIRLYVTTTPIPNEPSDARPTQ